MSLNKPITYEMTPSAAKAVNSTLNNGFFTPVTGVEEQEGIAAPEPLEASTSTGYLPDATSREGQSLINKWTGKALIGSMTPEQIEALPRDYSKRVKDRIDATILAGQVNNAQNNAGNFIFSKALPAGLTIAGLGPFGSLVNSMGFLPALGTTAASIGGGYLGATGLGYVGRKIDEKYGTKLEPWMSIGGGFLGGALGAAGGYGLSSKIAQYNAYKPWAEKVFSPDMLFDAKQAIYGNQLANLRDHEIRMNKPNTYKTVLSENGPTINAAGNAEGIIINPLVNRIYNLQVTKGLQSHNPSKLTREELIGLPKSERASYRASLGKSKITPEERMGIPKGERNSGKYNGITFFRTLDHVPAINSDGFVDLTSQFNTFLNTTSDDLVHLHSMYPNLQKHALAIDPEAFRGSTLTTLDPSDHIFIRETVKVKPKHVTLITGDPEAIALAQQRGFNVITNPKLKIYWQRGGNQKWRPDFSLKNSKGEWSMFSTSDFKNLYDKEVRKIVTNGFSRPKMNMYEKLSKQTGLPLKTQSFNGKNFVRTYPGVKWSPSDFKYVVYNPASPAEQYLMMDHGLNVMTDVKFQPDWKFSNSWGDREQWIRIRKALDQMKQNIKPLKHGGKLISKK